jgi:hypothetical protein
MKRIRLLFYLFLAISFCNVITIAQESSSGFLIGAFIAASDSAEYTLYNNYDQILDCGLNSVFQNAKKTDTSNLTQLSQFSFVYAANDTSPNHAMNDGNKDWVSYFTHAKYFK